MSIFSSTTTDNSNEVAGTNVELQPNVEMMSPMVEGESVSPSMNVVQGTKRVRAIYAFRPDREGPEFRMESDFDFERVSNEQLLLLGMYAAKVKVQAQLREIYASQGGVPVGKFATVDVLDDVVKATRKPADQLAVAKKQLSKLTSEQRRELLEALSQQDVE